MNLPTSRAEQLRAAHGLEAELSKPWPRSDAARDGRRAWPQRGLDSRPPFTPAASVAGTCGGHHPGAPAGSGRAGGRPRRAAAGAELLFRLNDLDRRVLELRLGFADGEPRSFAHTARVLEISATRVRRIEARALETLRGFCPQQASAQL